MEGISLYQIGELEEFSKAPNNFVIVPTAWVTFNKDSKIVANYLPLPHGDEDAQLIEDFVSKRCTPPKDWKEFVFRPVAEACTYSDAVQKLCDIKLKLNKKDTRKSKNNVTFDISKLIDKDTQVYTIDQPKVVEILQTIPTAQVQEDEQPLNNSIMLVPGNGGEVTIGSIDDEIVVESEVTEEFNELFNSQNNTLYNGISDNNKIRTENLSVQPSAQFSTGVKSTSNYRNEAIKPNQHSEVLQNPAYVLPSSKSDPALKVNTTGKAQKRRRSEIDEDSELEELLENENTTLQDLKKILKKMHRHTKKKFDQQATQLSDIGTTLSEVRTLVVETRAMREKEDILSFNELCRQHNLNLPLEELDDFLDFDNQIKSKGDLYKSLKKYFISNIATCDTVKVQVTNILKRFFYGKFLSTKYTAQKKLKTDDSKKIFKDTSFSILLEECMLHCYGKNIADGKNNYLTALSATFNCCRDWKNTRRTKSNEEED